MSSNYTQRCFVFSFLFIISVFSFIHQLFEPSFGRWLNAMFSFLRCGSVEQGVFPRCFLASILQSFPSFKPSQSVLGTISPEATLIHVPLLLFFPLSALHLLLVTLHLCNMGMKPLPMYTERGGGQQHETQSFSLMRTAYCWYTCYFCILCIQWTTPSLYWKCVAITLNKATGHPGCVNRLIIQLFSSPLEPR